MRCQILCIGTDSAIHGSVRTLLEAEGLIAVQHVESADAALAILDHAHETELPHILMIQFDLGSSAALDFVLEIRSNHWMRATGLVVWGSKIPAHLIEGMYAAGADCVQIGQFTTERLEPLRQFCRTCTIADEGTKNRRPIQLTSTRATNQRAQRNIRLGKLFVRTACLSAALWVCSVPGTPIRQPADLAPGFVYAGLTFAGVTLRR